MWGAGPSRGWWWQCTGFSSLHLLLDSCREGKGRAGSRHGKKGPVHCCRCLRLSLEPWAAAPCSGPHPNLRSAGDRGCSGGGGATSRVCSLSGSSVFPDDPRALATPCPHPPWYLRGSVLHPPLVNPGSTHVGCYTMVALLHVSI